MKKIIYSILIVLLVVIGSIFTFHKEEKNSTLKTVKVAEVTHSIFYAPFYTAINNGYFEEENIKINLILTPGADKVTAAVLSNDADIGFSGSEACIYVYNSGEKDYLKTFAQATQKDGSFILSREKIDNFKLEDLKGKTILGGRIGGMPEMTLEWVLKENNINPDKDLKIDTSIQFAAMSGAFIGGAGDFVSLFEPTASQIEKEGYGYIVASLGQLGGNVPYTSFSARKSYIKNNKDIIKGFKKAIQKGLDYVNNNSSKDIAKSIKKSFPDTNINDLEKQLENYKRINAWPTTTTFTKEAFDHLQDIIIEAKQLDKKVKYEDLIEISD